MNSFQYTVAEPPEVSRRFVSMKVVAPRQSELCNVGYSCGSGLALPSRYPKRLTGGRALPLSSAIALIYGPLAQW